MHIGSLLNFDADTENTDDHNVYLDFSSYEFGAAPVNRLVWGEYSRKPSCQRDWDRLVMKSCQKIEAQADPGEHDFRPRVKDLTSGHFFLIDTGAALSVIPKSLCQGKMEVDKSSGLQAVNGSKIPTSAEK